MNDPATASTVTADPDALGPTEPLPLGQPRRSSLRSRLVLLAATLGLAVLTGTCAVLALIGFVHEPNIPELFPVVLCGGVSAVSLFAAVGLFRETLQRPRE